MEPKQVCTKSLSEKALSLVHEFLYINFQDFTTTKPNNGLHVVTRSAVSKFYRRVK